MNKMIQAGNFSSISDVVNTSIIFFLGKISEEKIKTDFDFSILVEDMPADNSDKKKVVVALNGYSNTELEHLSNITNKNKSFIVRMALFRFFDYYNNIEKTETVDVLKNTDPKENLLEEKLLVSENELEAIVQKMVDKILKDKRS